MQVNKDYLLGLGLGLQGLRSSGQFCDAMVCVGSARILVHKVVLSAASKTLHDMALNFDMMPHQEHDQLKIIIPPDVSLFAVNMFINFIYTGQLELNSQIVAHVERLASLYGVTQLLNQCQEFIQRSRTPDSQNLNLRTVSQTEADSSLNGPQSIGSHHRLSGTPDASSQFELSRSNSSCSGISTDFGQGFSLANVKTEPAHLAAYEEEANRHNFAGPSHIGKDQQKGALGGKSISMLEKLMSPVVNLQKLPPDITPDVIVLVSDDEGDNSMDDEMLSDMPTPVSVAPPQFSLKEKEAIANEAKRHGIAQVAELHNVRVEDVENWMILFGLQEPIKRKQVDTVSDLAVVRWIVQQQEINGSVDLNNMREHAITVHQPTNPKFCASKTWLGNFLRRNMSLLEGTKFVKGDKTVMNVFGNVPAVTIKREVNDDEEEEDVDDSEPNVLDTLGDGAVLEDVPLNEQSMVNDAIFAGLNSNFSVSGTSGSKAAEDDFTNSYVPEGEADAPEIVVADKPTTQGSIVTPFGKRPIIVGQSKSLDAKSERKIVQWVLEKYKENGYVFTDDFKNYARSLYKGEKLFAATQCWMKKFLRRNRVLKDVKFCSKFKNTYTNEEKVMAVSLAKRFGVAYAAKHSGINQKVIHHWKLSADKGLLNLDNLSEKTLSSLEKSSSISVSPLIADGPGSSSTSSAPSALPNSKSQASHGIVPEFEDNIIKQIKELQAKEGSVNYNDISQISQSIYKETRPMFKASYGWIRSFMERRAADLVGIELENVSKVLVDNDENSQKFTSQEISQMVDDALKDIGDDKTASSPVESELKKIVRPVVVGPSVMFDRKTEKKLSEWALEKQQQNGYVFTDDFKLFAKSLHTGPKHFSASSGWMSLFLRRHRELKDVKWKSKFKSVYTEQEKKAAVMEAKRLGTGHVARQLGIDSSLLCAWRIKMDRETPKQQTFWKGTKLKKFGKGLPKFHPIAPLGASATPASVSASNDACRGVVPEFEKRIVDLIHEEHNKEGSISYEEMSRLSQSVYKETRPAFKASYAWIRNFMKRNEHQLSDLNIDNVKKVFIPEEESHESSVDMNVSNPALSQLFHKRPIIVGQSRSLDTKTEKKLVQWVVEQQEKNGYVFLDQFKSFAQSLYKGEKKFAATQAWRIKFLRRNHAALKHVKFTSSFRNQYTLEEKKVIVQEAKKFGTGHVSKKTGIDHCLINQWRLKLERSGMIPVDDGPSTSAEPKVTEGSLSNSGLLSKFKKIQGNVGPGLYSVRGIVPALEKKIVQLVMNKMDDEGSVSYRDVSLLARAVYKETRPNFKASYNWIKDFIKRNKKDLRHVEFEPTNKRALGSELDVEVLIPEDTVGDVESYLEDDGAEVDFEIDSQADDLDDSQNDDITDHSTDPMIVIDNPEAPNYAAMESESVGSLAQITSKKPIIIGKARHFSRKDEKKIVEWLVQTQEREGFVFTDDFRRYARSMYTGEPGKFGATNAWITKFLRRNRLENKIEFCSRLVGNNPKFEKKIVELILEQQEKEGSVSNDDIQQITQSVYKEIRPNFRACYNWIRGFIKRHKDELAGVDLENVKKVFIPDDNEKDGVLVRDYDPTMNMQLFDSTSDLSQSSFGQSSTCDPDNSLNFSSMQPFATSTPSSSSSSIIEKMANQKRPIIIAPPKSLDIKTEKKLVQWMVEQQEQNGCVYLDLFKQYAKSIHTGPKHFAATQAWMVKFKQRNHEALKNIVIKSRFRNEYSTEEKIAIVEEAKRLGCNHVGRKLGINGGVIYSWKVQVENAEKMGTSVSLSDSFESKVSESTRGVVPEFEAAIVNMVIETQRAKGSVSYEDISMCARSVYKETRPNFKASNNWTLDFIRKFKDEFKDVVFENQRKNLTEEEKLHILSEEKKYGTEHVVKKRNISSSTLYHWRRQFKAKSVPIPKFKAIVSSKIKKKYAKQQIKTYTIEEKRKMVAVAEENGITYTSLKLGISRNMLRKWIQYFRDQGENIVINFTPASTMKKELEQQVVAWVLQQNEELGIVLTQRILEHAKKVFEESFTNCSATLNWLEGFLAQNGDKFENVRFRDKGDTDLEFSDDIKLKLARHAQKHGACKTADLTGLLPKIIYHWRRKCKLMGMDLSVDTPSVKPEVEEPDEPKSMMQKKLDKIAASHNEKARKQFVSEASVHGTSAVASKHKIPLPLLLKWMKQYVGGKDESDESHSTSSSVSREGSQEKLKVRLPSVERMAIYKKHSQADKKKLIEEAKKDGPKAVSERSGVGLSTLYSWIKDERESSTESQRRSMERASPASKSTAETSNPHLLRNVKKEPGTYTKSDSSLVESSDENSFAAGRIMRKYSDEFKTEVAKRALEIGARKTALELNVPFTNVKRWLDQRKASLAKAKKSPGSSSKTTLPLAGTLAGMKRKLDTSAVTTSSPKRVKYTDDDRIEFVKMSETDGVLTAANKAAVSIDVLYKWRSKYLPGIRLAARTGATEEEETSLHPMPQPRSMHFNKALVKSEISTEEDIDEPHDFIQDVSITNIVSGSDELINAEHDSVSEPAFTHNKQDELKIPEGVDITESHVHAIDDNDIIAADQILEMMDAESQNKDSFSQDDDVSVQESLAEETTETVEHQAVEEDASEDSNLDMIKIVNVKSEAAIEISVQNEKQKGESAEWSK